MNIVIFGAGAIGSLIGAILSKYANVYLISRKEHAYAIKKSGLEISGKTIIKKNMIAETSIEKIPKKPDLLILTVKSYDTESAIRKIKKQIKSDTVILSLQNGLDNIEKIKKYISKKQIIAGITTHGATFTGPGKIDHTGIGSTIIGEINGKQTDRIIEICGLFNKSGIKTEISNNIIKEIWIKAIINSSINPVTTFFHCKNGYLLENPVLERIVEEITVESTSIAINHGIKITKDNMINRTKKVIRKTKENYSSMLQSYNNGKRTEIDTINGKFVEIGKNNKIEPFLNEILVYSIKSIM